MGGAKTKRALRVLAIIVPIVGVIATALALSIILPKAPPAAAVHEAVRLGGGALVLAMALLIAWRAGDVAPNVSMALALGFVFLNDATWSLLEAIRRIDMLPAQVLLNILSLCALSFFVRAAQSFPRPLTPADLATSPTIWGKLRPLRAGLTFLLRPVAVWALIGILTLITVGKNDAALEQIVTISMMTIGLVYFHVSFRNGDAESRRKVLWFLEAVLAVLALRLIVLGLRAAIGDSLTSDQRLNINIGIAALNNLILIVCIGLAIFRAGAVSPALVVRKTVVYGATISALLFLFAAVEIFIVERLVEYFEVTDHIATAVLGAAFGLGFHPLKHRIEHFSQRLAPTEAVVAPPHPAR